MQNTDHRGRWSVVVLVGGRFFSQSLVGGRWFLWSVVGYFLGKWSVVGGAWLVVPGRWSVVGVTVVGGLWSLAGQWAVVLYYVAYLGLITFKCSVEKQLHGQQFNFHECGRYIYLRLCSTNNQHKYSWNSDQRNEPKFKISVGLFSQKYSWCLLQCKITHISLS